MNPTTGVVRPDARLRWARLLLVTGTAVICLLQILALPVRNPFTRTMSSYEYTWAGALFPIGLGIFAAGLLLLGWQVPARHRAARWALLGAACGAAAAAVFPSGSGARDEALWPGEVHRWGSIALVVGALSGALLLAHTSLPRRSRRTIGLLTVSGLVAGVLFLTGQFATAPRGVLGYAPLAGGLSQRILIGITVAAMLHLVGMLATVAAKRPPRPTGPRAVDMVRSGHGRRAVDPAADPSPVHP
jgi:hypothetical protein